MDFDEKKMQEISQYLTANFHTRPAMRHRIPLIGAIALLGSIVTTVFTATPAIANTATPPNEQNAQAGNSISGDTIYSGTLEPGDEIFAYDGSFYDGYPVQGNLGNSLTVSLTPLWRL